MPPLPRLLFLLSTTLFSLSFIPSITSATFGFHCNGDSRGGLSTRGPSLFPKSAIITLMDDDSTFFFARPAAFGPELPEEGENTGGSGDGGGGGGGRRSKGLTGRLVAVPDGEDGCGEEETPPGEGDENEDKAASIGGKGLRRREADEGRDMYINGRIVLLPRGGCGFLQKVLWAQRRGAIAVVVGDNVSGRGLVTMYAKVGDTSNVVIPSIFTTHTTAQLLISLIPRQPTFTPTLPLNPIHSRAPRFQYENFWRSGAGRLTRKKNTVSNDKKREGLWVSLTCTPGPASPFLDTLLVLVVSPLGTLGIVYTMLAIRARLQRRRWRAPKSVVESLPVRVYTEPSGGSAGGVVGQRGEEGTDGEVRRKQRKKRLCGVMRESGSSRASSSVTLVNGAGDTPPEPPPQKEQPAPTPVKNPETENGDGNATPPTSPPPPPPPPPNIPSSSLECVVCLEEYIPNVSRVMRLPCGHEFHVGCITPWLVTRRRTCPICKGDVVKMVREKGGVVSREGGDVERGWGDGEDSSSDESGNDGEVVGGEGVGDVREREREQEREREGGWESDGGGG
ncbi:hypothetical protein BGX38DRAFT_1328340 [Terfezia claveryi]|nr:hypothetical protein BGX38DRAFT_1328340 [Terfezia claveryi]